MISYQSLECTFFSYQVHYTSSELVSSPPPPPPPIQTQSTHKNVLHKNSYIGGSLTQWEERPSVPESSIEIQPSLLTFCVTLAMPLQCPELLSYKTGHAISTGHCER